MKPPATGYLDALRVALEHAESVVEFYETWHIRETVAPALAERTRLELRDRLRQAEWQALETFGKDGAA